VLIFVLIFFWKTRQAGPLYKLTNNIVSFVPDLACSVKPGPPYTIPLKLLVAHNNFVLNLQT